LRQNQEAQYYALLSAQELAFIRKADSEVAASFGAAGGYVDRLRSNERL